MANPELDTNQIKSWRSIVTLLVFIFTNLVVLFPFHIPLFVPRPLVNAVLDFLGACRVISPRQHHDGDTKYLVRLNFPMNFLTAPLLADLFLLAILAIGRQEVHDGTIGAESISPLDVMVFFITLAYIAISIDASGLIRYLAFKVLQKGGSSGHRLFFYLYSFFFVLGTFIGNDPIILSGTAFLAYMTRVSSNIIHPRAWIHAQFAIANISSAILVSSNPTNLVLAGAFNIKFINYTANMIVPVVVTSIVLFPFLLYIVFADEALVPKLIKMHELSEEAKRRPPVNPNIPNARGNAEEEEKKLVSEDQGALLSLEEIMNPFLDKGGAAFGGVIMAATLITVVALNAVSQSEGEKPVFWVTLPAAFVMFCWDLGFGWLHRHETREIARKGRKEVENARLEQADAARRAELEMDRLKPSILPEKEPDTIELNHDHLVSGTARQYSDLDNITTDPTVPHFEVDEAPGLESSVLKLASKDGKKQNEFSNDALDEKGVLTNSNASYLFQESPVSGDADREKQIPGGDQMPEQQSHSTLVSLTRETYRWLQETFPTVMAVAGHLPFALVPFAFTMFILVQALVTKGWVPVFAYGWDHWVNKTGTVGAIGGMAFLSVILCNFAGTNIGTTILLSRVIQSWETIHADNGLPISDRTFWATVYAMAIGVNYGAFSTAFSASLAGLLWRDILARKHIHVRRLEFARVNLPIIAISMAVGCAVLIGQVYVVRGTHPYNSKS